MAVALLDLPTVIVVVVTGSAIVTRAGQTMVMRDGTTVIVGR